MSTTSLDGVHFAVVDTETTGLFPGKYDRVVELAVTRVDAKGNVLDEYATLVNPERDLGLTHRHGIEGRDVIDAPRFVDVAGDLALRLKGAVLVGHNVRFDAEFLRAEYARLGLQVPLHARLCTLLLGHRLGVAGGRRNLGDVCARLGIHLKHAHCAVDDARACAQLLGHILRAAERKGLTDLSDLGCEEGPSAPEAWPSLSPSGRSLLREGARARRAPASAYLAQLITRLPAADARCSEGRVAYLELLDRVLEDRRVTPDEAEALLGLALQWGLTRVDAQAAHAEYLASLVAVARSDGKVTESERRDLDYVAGLLGIEARAVDEALAQEPAVSVAGTGAMGTAESLRGKTVCFTGTLRCKLRGELLGREEAERLASQAGLTVLTGVSKRLDILVVADPETLSGKARKARDLGTRIMADVVFFRALGISVE